MLGRASTFVLACVAIVLGCTLPGSAQQPSVRPVPDARLASWISGGTQSVKEGAVAHVLTIPPEQRSPLVQDALIKELVRLNAERFARFTRLRAGQQVTPEDVEGSERFSEYRAKVTQAVSQLSTPAAIPALVGALGSGPMVSRALARFGAAAVDPLVNAARGNHPDRHATADALHALEGIASKPVSLSRSDRDKVLTAAVERLSGSQHFVVVAAACDLAVATKDPALRNRVQQLANDSSQISRMGITEPGAAAFVRKAAADALARTK